MKNSFLLIAVFSILFSGISGEVNSQVRKEQANTSQNDPADPTTEQWSEFLSDYVTKDGYVNYKDMTYDKDRLEKIVRDYDAMEPLDKWTENRELCFWINLYNIHVVNLVVQNYHVYSINDIDKAFDQVVCTIQGKDYSLNDIENNVLRSKFEEPRIHFAINCASASCPAMLNEAYVPEKIETQLAKQTYAFINNDELNSISEGKLEISKLFEWFERDFTKRGGVISFIQDYTSVEIKSDAKIAYKEYDWSLNGK